MQIWIDVEDASGNKIGDGPIITAAEWQATRRLDAAGTFSFQMAAADPRAAYLRHKRIVRCWSADERDGIVERGAGIIDHIEVKPGGDNAPTMLQVSGDDLFRELVYRTVGQLNLYDDVVDAANLALLGSTTVPITLPATINLDPLNSLVIGYPEAFSRVDITLASPLNWVAATVTAEYWNDTASDWETLIVKANTTIAAGVPFAQSGYISFDVPASWGMRGGDYEIRLFCERIDIAQFQATAIDVHRILPTEDALQMIMALAPDGWSLDGAGYFATETSVELPISGGSVLAALGRLAAQTGEHFRLGVSGRRVHWLGSTLQSSGLQAIAASERFDRTMLITALRQTSDTYDLYTRLYLYGGGEGDGRLTLARTTRSAPAGFAMSAANSYVENTAAVAEYGRIDWTETFTDIVPADISATASIAAANTLFDRGYQLLMRRSQLQYAYEIDVVPSTELLLPGQTLHVSYDEWNDGYHAVAIHQDLVALEVTQSISAGGVLTSRLTVATVDYFPSSDDRVMAESLASIQTDRSKRLPESFLTSSGKGVPTYIAVQSGMVVAVNRVTPQVDGFYDMGVNPILQIVDGVIVGISS